MATLKDDKLDSGLEKKIELLFTQLHRYPNLLYSAAVTFRPENEHVMLFDFM